MLTDATCSPRLAISEVCLHPLLKPVSIQEISCNALKELSVQCRASIRPMNRIKINSSLLNSIRHLLTSNSVPFLPPQTHTSDTLGRDGNSRWKPGENFSRSSLSHQQRPRELLELRYYHHFCQAILSRQIAVCAPQHF